MPILAQLVQRYLPGCKIELAADEKIKAREFSYSAQSCLLMLGQLAYWCITWAKHRQRKAAVKLHMVANVANMLPKFADEEEGRRRTHGAVTSRHVLGLVADYVGRFDTEAYCGVIG